MIANIMNVELEELTVDVTAKVDVRGTLLIESSVHIGFQSMHSEVRYRAKPGTSKDQLAMLEKLAERCCIVRQTLKGGVPIETVFTAMAPAGQ